MAKRASTGAQGLTRRQMSRAKREALLQRWILTGAVILAVAAIGVIAYGAIDQEYLRPNRAVVTMGDQKIAGIQFETQVKVSHFIQLGGQFPLSTFGMDAQSYSQRILDQMTNDLVSAQKAKELGISVSDQEVEREAQLAFGYEAGTPAPTPTPTETTVPTGGPPTATSTFVITLTPTATRTPIPGATATPTSTSTPTSTATPTPAASQTATTTPTPQPTATPLTVDAYNTNMKDFLDRATTATGLTADQVKKSWYDRIRASLLHDKLIVALNIQADNEKTMLHAAHILLPTEDEAKKALDRIKGGEDFEKVAAEVSTDPSNAYKGGDLGWFGPGVMDKDFEAAALKVPVGQISNPVKSSFGWHLIKVYDRKQVLMTGDERQQQVETKFADMLEQWKKDYKVKTEDIWTEFVPDIQ